MAHGCNIDLTSNKVHYIILCMHWVIIQDITLVKIMLSQLIDLSIVEQVMNTIWLNKTLTYINQTNTCKSYLSTGSRKLSFIHDESCSLKFNMIHRKLKPNTHEYGINTYSVTILWL